ncbi:hypothetical protein GALMADRAFT_1050750 [Galerina marginata CBS 339.88]|uniref:Uncharacterized protein n=1 Tax=Galerina marginata (strain CBS 339.88) TaxID=685588 RepID=A0A067SMR5_GALM3|nr:hypothetical protein GALMADRAFT_1050750 [Galerina marginata CBS 339.88]
MYFFTSGSYALITMSATTIPSAALIVGFISLLSSGFSNFLPEGIRGRNAGRLQQNAYFHRDITLKPNYQFRLECCIQQNIN